MYKCMYIYIFIYYQIKTNFFLFVLQVAGDSLERLPAINF